MTGLVVWAVAAALYGWFRWFYDNRRPPLGDAEIDALLPRLPEHARANAEELARLRDFLVHDDGREFAMLNLVKLAAEPVPHPETGVPTPAGELLEGYTRVFFRALLPFHKVYARALLSAARSRLLASSGSRGLDGSR